MIRDLFQLELPELDETLDASWLSELGRMSAARLDILLASPTPPEWMGRRPLGVRLELARREALS